MECLLVGYNANHISVQGYFHADCVGDDSVINICPPVFHVDETIALSLVCGECCPNVLEGFGVVHPRSNVFHGVPMLKSPPYKLGFKLFELLLYSRGVCFCLRHCAGELFGGGGEFEGTSDVIYPDGLSRIAVELEGRRDSRDLTMHDYLCDVLHLVEL